MRSQNGSANAADEVALQDRGRSADETHQIDAEADIGSEARGGEELLSSHIAGRSSPKERLRDSEEDAEHVSDDSQAESSDDRDDDSSHMLAALAQMQQQQQDSSTDAEDESRNGVSATSVEEVEGIEPARQSSGNAEGHVDGLADALGDLPLDSQQGKHYSCNLGQFWNFFVG